MKTTEIHLSDLSKIQYRYFTAEIPALEYFPVLIVEFSGECGFGSSSNGDASFMAGIVAAGFQAWEPSCYILDLQNLKYEWGDMMCALFNPPHDLINLTGKPAEFPFATVCSDLNREGLTSLIAQEMSGDPSKILFDTMEEAVSRVVEIAHKTYKLT